MEPNHSPPSPLSSAPNTPISSVAKHSKNNTYSDSENEADLKGPPRVSRQLLPPSMKTATFLKLPSHLMVPTRSDASIGRSVTSKKKKSFMKKTDAPFDENLLSVPQLHCSSSERASRMLKGETIEESPSMRSYSYSEDAPDDEISPIKSIRSNRSKQSSAAPDAPDDEKSMSRLSKPPKRSILDEMDDMEDRMASSRNRRSILDEMDEMEDTIFNSQSGEASDRDRKSMRSSEKSMKMGKSKKNNGIPTEITLGVNPGKSVPNEAKDKLGEGKDELMGKDELIGRGKVMGKDEFMGEDELMGTKPMLHKVMNEKPTRDEIMTSEVHDLGIEVTHRYGVVNPPPKDTAKVGLVNSQIKTKKSATASVLDKDPSMSRMALTSQTAALPLKHGGGSLKDASAEEKIDDEMDMNIGRIQNQVSKDLALSDEVHEEMTFGMMMSDAAYFSTVAANTLVAAGMAVEHLVLGPPKIPKAPEEIASEWRRRKRKAARDAGSELVYDSSPYACLTEKAFAASSDDDKSERASNRLIDDLKEDETNASSQYMNALASRDAELGPPPPPPAQSLSGSVSSTSSGVTSWWLEKELARRDREHKVKVTSRSNSGQLLASESKKSETTSGVTREESGSYALDQGKINDGKNRVEQTDAPKDLGDGETELLDKNAELLARVALATGPTVAQNISEDGELSCVDKIAKKQDATEQDATDKKGETNPAKDEMAEEETKEEEDPDVNNEDESDNAKKRLASPDYVADTAIVTPENEGEPADSSILGATIVATAAAVAVSSAISPTDSQDVAAPVRNGMDSPNDLKVGSSENDEDVMDQSKDDQVVSVAVSNPIDSQDAAASVRNGRDSPNDLKVGSSENEEHVMDRSKDDQAVEDGTRIGLSTSGEESGVKTISTGEARSIASMGTEVQSNKAAVLVKSLDDVNGICKGDIMLSLVHAKGADAKSSASGGTQIRNAVWRMRIMRRCFTLRETGQLSSEATTPTRAVKGKRNSLARSRSSLPVDVDNMRVVGVMNQTRALEDNAIDHLRHDEFAGALELYDDIFYAYQEAFKQREWNCQNETDKDDQVLSMQPYLGNALHNMGVVHFLNQDYTEALSCFEKAAERRRSPDGTPNSDELTTLVKIALCHCANDQFSKAHNALEVCLESAKGYCKTITDFIQIAEILNNLGCLSFMGGQSETSMQMFIESLGVQQAVLSHSLYGGSVLAGHSTNLNMSITRANVAFLKMCSNDHVSAIISFEAALSTQQMLLYDAHETLVGTMDHLAAANLLGGNKEKAANMLERMLRAEIKVYGIDDPRCENTRNKIRLVNTKDHKVKSSAENNDDEKVDDTQKDAKQEIEDIEDEKVADAQKDEKQETEDIEDKKVEDTQRDEHQETEDSEDKKMDVTHKCEKEEKAPKIMKKLKSLLRTSKRREASDGGANLFSL